MQYKAALLVALVWIIGVDFWSSVEWIRGFLWGEPIRSQKKDNAVLQLRS